MIADYPFPTARAARVLLMGDSITEGSQIGAANYGKTWCCMEVARFDGVARRLVYAMGEKIA
ncbi:hypothetical protein [Stenotrophomonas sp. TWI1183]|uniref:hypothetical protein n=1 Tax=Stenotrophomonas sp. TWI1183 TaxID=3136799 RepID=UPI00320B51A9